jgi:hypothetical protein
MIGNLADDDNLTTINGTIMKDNYGGGFTINQSNEIMPESILINSYAYDTVIGSPVLYLDADNTYQIIGMVSKMFNDQPTSSYIIAINNKLLLMIIESILSKWRGVRRLILNGEENLNSEYIDTYIRNGFPKAWLGIDAIYYSYKSKYYYPEMSNFNYIGGLIVRNIVEAYDVVNNRFIYDGSHNSNKSSIKLYSPLENSILHHRIVQSGVPIIIKFLRFYNLLTDQLEDLYLGKYSNQKSYSNYVYGQQYYDSIDIEGYTSIVKYFFNPIIIDYYYYNGKEWIEEMVNIGSINDDFYIVYTNGSSTYYQSKFEYPDILYNYQKFYNINI